MSASSQATEKKLFFGLKRSKPEPIDRLLCMSHDKVDLPTKFSLRDKVKQVYDQLTLSSCSSNAAANFLLQSDKVNYNISRLYLYFCARYLDNNQMLPLTDHGSTLKNCFVSMATYHLIDECKYEFSSKTFVSHQQEVSRHVTTQRKQPSWVGDTPLPEPGNHCRSREGVCQGVQVSGPNQKDGEGELVKTGGGVGGIHFRGSQGERYQETVLVCYPPYSAKEAKKDSAVVGCAARKDGEEGCRTVGNDTNARLMAEGGLAECMENAIKFSLILCTHPFRGKNRGERAASVVGGDTEPGPVRGSVNEER